MKKWIFVSWVIFTSVTKVVCQSVQKAPLFYYPSLDSIAPIQRGVAESAVIDWKLDLLNIDVDERWCRYILKIKFLVNIGGDSKAFNIDQFVADTNFIIAKKIDFNVTRENVIYTEVRLKKDQIIMFCLDGGRIYYFKPD